MWDDAFADVARLLATPPDPGHRVRAQGYARQVLGLDDWFASRNEADLETAAYLDALAFFKGVDRETIVEAVGLVASADHARVVERRFTPLSEPRPRPGSLSPTGWVDLPKGIRVGVHPLPEAERTSVAFLLPFGRENGPSPVVARLFAHGLTPGWGVSPWSVRSGRDHTVLWWAGAPRSLEWVLRDLAARLSGMTPSEEDLAREKERAADPDPFPEPGLPAGVSTALLEGFRAVEGKPRAECPAPVDAADAAAQISDWFSIGGARVVVAGPFRLNSTTVDSTTSLLVRCLAPLPARTGTPPRPIPRPLPDFPGAGPGAKGRSCRAFAIPPTASTPEFAACLLVGLRNGVPFRTPLSGNRLPPVIFDPLMDPGVLVFATPPGRGPEDPPWRLPLIDGEPSSAERRLLKDLLGGRLGAGREPALDHPSRTVPSPVAAAVRAALLDFRGIDGEAVRDAIDAVPPEVYAEAVRRLKEATPAEFRVEVE